VRQGDVVAAGAVLARLDRRRLEIMLGQNRAERAVAEALVRERQAEVAWRERDLELLRESFAQQAVNPRELRDGESAAVMAAARNAQAEQQLVLIEASGSLLEQRLADMTIVAPFDGVVVRRLVEPGEWLSEGDAVVELISRGRVEAWLDVAQQHYAPLVAQRDPIDVAITPAGAVASSDDWRAVPLVDPQARSFNLVVNLIDPAGTLVPGMSVTAALPTGRMEEYLTLPNDAILRGPTGAYVYVVRGGAPGEPARVFPTPVEPVFSTRGRSAIRGQPLQPGDQVVVEGNERLFPSMPVLPQAVAEPAGGPRRTG
jgi:RND family efflux transporter MFP subunit